MEQEDNAAVLYQRIRNLETELRAWRDMDEQYCSATYAPEHFGVGVERVKECIGNLRDTVANLKQALDNSDACIACGKHIIFSRRHLCRGCSTSDSSEQYDICDTDIVLEGLSAWAAFSFLLLGRKVHTENGKQDIVAHIQDRHCADYEIIVYKCCGCGAICCQCFGGAPDPRCDNCVAGEDRHVSMISRCLNWLRR